MVVESGRVMVERVVGGGEGIEEDMIASGVFWGMGCGIAWRDALRVGAEKGGLISIELFFSSMRKSS